MTDILLAHSFFLRDDAKQLAKMRPYPPLGTLYAAALLRRRGYSVSVFDAMFADGEPDFARRLAALRPRVVALHEDQFHFLHKMCLGHVRRAAWRMARMARDSGAHVLAAGADVTDHPEAYLEQGVEFALLGEADQSLGLLVDELIGNRGSGVGSIPGVACVSPQSGQVERSAPRRPEREPDVFPFPAWDLIDVEAYRAAWKRAHGYFSLNMVTTRGCPFHCNWCAKPIWGQRYAIRSPANVAEEMAHLKREYRPDHIWFADDIFGLQTQWVADFAREIEKRGAAIPFMIQSRVDLMTERAVEGLARAGCTEVWLGVESGSQKILDAMDKGISVGQVPLARELLQRAGIRTCYFLQLGYPGETLADIAATVRLVRETLPDDIGVSVSYPLPGTRFYEMVRMQLGGKHHWDESNDLDMMFEGRYRTPFYRRLHDWLHRDLEVRLALAERPGDPQSLVELQAAEQEWLDLRERESDYRSSRAIVLEKFYEPLEAPDLSRRWN